MTRVTTMERRLGSALFRLADERDEPELGRLLDETPMEGSVRLQFTRRPSYLRAAGIQGAQVQVIVAHVDGELAGVGTRALRDAWIDGERRTVGYLSDLRVAQRFRGTTHLARGYRFLRELHEDGRASLYTSVIVADNAPALSTLASGRRSLPTYTDMGLVRTPLLRLRKRRRELDSRIRRATAADWPRIVDKLNENRMQFAPIHVLEDFVAGGRYPGLAAEDFLLAIDGERVRGVMAVWNQSAFRQTVVHGYAGAMRVFRPVLNALGLAALPRPGGVLEYSTVAFVSTDDDATFEALLRRATNDELRRGRRQLVVGLHERDSRARCLEEYSRTEFAGRLFTVTFGSPPSLDDRVPFVEAALL